jgi:hypothetical protein
VRIYRDNVCCENLDCIEGDGHLRVQISKDRSGTTDYSPRDTLDSPHRSFPRVPPRILNECSLKLREESRSRLAPGTVPAQCRSSLFSFRLPGPPSKSRANAGLSVEFCKAPRPGFVMHVRDVGSIGHGKASQGAIIGPWNPSSA